MKAFCKKYLPWVLILIGVLRLLWEHFPGRLAFLHVLGSDHFGWVFWLCGIFGIVWLLSAALIRTVRNPPILSPVPLSHV